LIFLLAGLALPAYLVVAVDQHVEIAKDAHRKFSVVALCVMQLSRATMKFLLLLLLAV